MENEKIKLIEGCGESDYEPCDQYEESSGSSKKRIGAKLLTKDDLEALETIFLV